MFLRNSNKTLRYFTYFKPLTTMSWIAAHTKRVGIGTTVLVLPMRHPLNVAKSIATIDQFSGGRVILGVAAGWLEAEFDALGDGIALIHRKSCPRAHADQTAGVQSARRAAAAQL